MIGGCGVKQQPSYVTHPHYHDHKKCKKKHYCNCNWNDCCFLLEFIYFPEVEYIPLLNGKDTIFKHEVIIDY